MTGNDNLTGAGLVSTAPEQVAAVMEQFDKVWIGGHCSSCGRKQLCADRSETG